MWTSYGRRDVPLVAPPVERLFAAIPSAERWYGPAAIAVLFLYPNPLIPLALAAVALSAAYRITGSRPTSRLDAPTVLRALDVGFALLLCGTLVGFVIAHDGEAAMVRLTGVLAAVALYYLGVGHTKDTRAIRRWGIALLAATTVGAAVVIALLRGQLPDSLVVRALDPALGWLALFPGVSGDTLDVNARFTVHQYGLAHLLLVSASFAVAAAVLGGRRETRIAGLLGLALLTPLLLATQARGAIVALALSASVIAGFRSKWAWMILPLAGAAFYVFLASGLISRNIEAEWLGVRLSYWTRTLALLSDFPLTGSGLGMRTFAEVFARYFGLPDPYQVSHTHNIYLQAYAEQGLLGMIGLAMVLVAGVSLGLRTIRHAADSIRWLVAGATGALLGSAVYGLTDQVPSSNFSLGLICGLLVVVAAAVRVATRQTLPREPRPAGYLTHRVPRVAVAAIALVGVALLAPRWASGLLVNLGAADLAVVGLERTLDADERGSRLQRAESLLAAAGDWNPNNVAAWRNLGWARLMRHDILGAHSAIAAADRVDVTPFERSQLARLAREAGLVERAIALLKDGGDEAALRDVAEYAWGQRRWSDAAAAYAALTELSPEEAEYASNTAIAVLNRGGDAETAMALLRDAVTKNPGAARNLARQLVLRGEPCRSDERRGGGRFECAAFWFSLASRVDPTYDRPEVELGSINYYQGRYGEAAAHFGEASRRDPRNPSTYNQLGDAYVKLGRLDEAVESFERGVQARPERADLHVHLARAYLLVGRRADAVRALTTATGLAPGNPAFREELERVAAGG